MSWKWEKGLDAPVEGMIFCIGVVLVLWVVIKGVIAYVESIIDIFDWRR